MNELVVPVRKYERKAGCYVFPDKVMLCSMQGRDAVPLKQLSWELAQVSVNTVTGKFSAQGSAVVLRRDRGLAHSEGYRMSIGRAGIEIVSQTAAGAYYAIQTLRDMIRLHGRELPCCRIEDLPTFNRRAVYHDCARGKVPKVETVKQLIEWLAHFKVNEIQLYIENAFVFRKHPAIGRGFSPYRPEDILEMQEHASLHHVKFVPSLTSFGHFDNILMLPEYQHLGELPGARGLPGGTTLCPIDPGSIPLLDDLYNEFLPLFEAEDFNACGDEPWDLGLGRSKRRASRRGLGRVYLDFILNIRDLCGKHGKRLNIWSDAVMKHPELLADLPKDIVYLNWDYSADGTGRMARSGEIHEQNLSFVGCTGTGGWCSHGSRLHLSMENIRRFAGICREQKAEGMMTTDWGDLGHRNYLGTSLCAFAYGAAHSWCSENVCHDKHIRNFTRLVFGDRRGYLARGLSVLGESPIGISQPQYFAMLESLTGPKPLPGYGHIFSGFRMERSISIDQIAASPEEVRKRAEMVQAIVWPEQSCKLGVFESLACREYVAAARLERAGCARIALARRLRSGKSVGSKELLRHAEDLTACATELEVLWHARNRPSRLRDNLAVLRAGAVEARKLAG